MRSQRLSPFNCADGGENVSVHELADRTLAAACQMAFEGDSAAPSQIHERQRIRA